MKREEFSKEFDTNVRLALKEYQKYLELDLGAIDEIVYEMPQEKYRDFVLSKEDVIDSLYLDEERTNTDIDIAVRRVSGRTVTVWVRPSAFPPIAFSKAADPMRLGSGPFRVLGPMMPASEWESIMRRPSSGSEEPE